MYRRPVHALLQKKTNWSRKWPTVPYNRHSIFLLILLCKRTTVQSRNGDKNRKRNSIRKINLNIEMKHFSTRIRVRAVKDYLQVIQ